MSYEEEFDRIMREKAEGLEPAFEEDHWLGARRLIDESRQSGRGFMKSLSLTIGVVLVGGFAALLWLSPEKSDEVLAEKGAVAVSALNLETGTVQQAASAEPSTFQAGTAVSSGPAKSDAEKPHISKSSAGPLHEKGSGSSPVAPAGTSVNGKAEILLSAVVPANTGAFDSQDKSTETAAAALPDDFVFLTTNGMMLDVEPGRHEARLSPLTAIRHKGDDYYDKKKDRGGFFVDAVAGAAFFTGWQASDRYDGRGMNWFAALNAGRTFAGSWQVASGIQLFNLAHLNEPFYVAESKSYDFGSVTSSTVITTSQLFYVGVPVKLTRVFQNGGRASLGMIGAQLWRSNNEITSQVIRDNSVLSETKSGNGKLYEGMNQQVLMLSAGYDLRVGRRISAGVEMVYGLTDLFAPNTYLERSERPVMVRAGLTYHFAQK